jgi:glycerophosphoryl diester phosphodiesterase
VVPELVAHRGHAARAPENTAAAIVGAMDAGARCVEIDVQISADGRAVLFHDRTLQRMCGVAGAVHERTLRELRALSCGESGKFGARFADEQVLDLAGFAEILRRNPHVFAFVEIKRIAIERLGARPILEIVLADLEDVLARCALISFDLPFLAAARAFRPLALGAVFDRWEERRAPGMTALAPEYLFFDLDGLPPTGSLAMPGSRVVVYEVADPAVARALAVRGVELVETFEIARMRAALAEARA